jgi:hypothetical protein
LQLLSDVLNKHRHLYTLHLEELIQKRLQYFKDQGLNSSLYYRANIFSTDHIAMSECDLNRILFNILSFIKHHNNRLKVEVSNDSHSLKLSFSSNGRRFPSRQKGLFFLPPQGLKNSYLASVTTLVQESGGQLAYSRTSPFEWCLDLQIPLVPYSNEKDNFPRQERSPYQLCDLRKAPSNEGFFFNRFFGRALAL